MMMMPTRTTASLRSTLRLASASSFSQRQFTPSTTNGSSSSSSSDENKQSITYESGWGETTKQNTLQRRFKSTLTAKGADILTKPDFDNAKAAFATKTTKELLRALTCFSLCQVRPLVWYAKELHEYSRKYLVGDGIMDAFMRCTMYGHFCAGETEARIQPKIAALKDAGIGSILDYAAEDDGSSSSIDANSREYDYESEHQCNQHVQTFLECIQSVGNLQKDAFAAIKVTALGNPKLLQRMATAIIGTKELFGRFDKDGDGFISNQEFERGLSEFFVDTNADIQLFRERVQELQELDNTKMVDYITWSNLLTPKDLPQICSACKDNFGPLRMSVLTEEEIALIDVMYDRGHKLAKAAAERGVRLLVDAEQTQFQPAIDNLVLDLQRQYNTGTIPIVYNTYQCYLKDASAELADDLQRSERYNYHFGAKLVRGAYMESERKSAKDEHRPSPIHDTIEETHHCYNESVRLLLEHSMHSQQNVEVMCATHNQQSIEAAIDAMEELGIPPDSPTICFAQLYGMMDNLSFNLGKHNFRVYKYVPYGQVKMVMPYLLRRAKENSAIAGGAGKELKMILAELSRRAFA